MTPPCDGDWCRQVVEALERVHEVEGHYLDEFHERRLQRELSDARFPKLFPISDPAHDRLPFYSRVWHSEGIYAARRYPPLRAALENATVIVGQHPTLAPLLKEDGRGYEFSVRILNHDRRTSCLAVVAGLMSRAQQIGQGGFRTALAELGALLDSSLDSVDPGSNELTIGYHVSIFYGLRLTEDLEIADGLVAVPLERTEPFLNRDVLERIAPSIATEYGWQGVGVILSPVPWKLTLGPGSDESALQLDWGGSFFEDARTFIELLALAHGVPVVPLMEISYCVHRTSIHLLGEPYYHGGTKPASWLRSFGNLWNPNDLDVSALDQAKHVFLDLDHQRLGELAPVVSRLSEALARTGQYAADDKILDVAIALEQMYELDQGEISFKLKTRAACFLESDVEARRRVFKDVEKFYDVRSAIVHRREARRNTKRKKKSSAIAKDEAFEKGFDVARDSVFRLLLEGSPKDWTEVVLASAGS